MYLEMANVEPQLLATMPCHQALMTITSGYMAAYGGSVTINMEALLRAWQQAICKAIQKYIFKKMINEALLV